MFSGSYGGNSGQSGNGKIAHILVNQMQNYY